MCVQVVTLQANQKSLGIAVECLPWKWYLILFHFLFVKSYLLAALSGECNYYERAPMLLFSDSNIKVQWSRLLPWS